MKPNSTRISKEEIIVILRAADKIIGQGGRTLLVKILKGSKEKKVLQLELISVRSMAGFVLKNRRRF